MSHGAAGPERQLWGPSSANMLRVAKWPLSARTRHPPASGRWFGRSRSRYSSSASALRDRTRLTERAVLDRALPEERQQGAGHRPQSMTFSFIEAISASADWRACIECSRRCPTACRSPAWRGHKFVLRLRASCGQVASRAPPPVALGHRAPGHSAL